MDQLLEYVRDQIWILEYPIRFSGIDLFARMTQIRFANGDLLIHSPCKIDNSLKQDIDDIGQVKYIVAPGNFHHLYVPDFQQSYPDAETFIVPGLEKKRPDIHFEWILGNRPDHRWQDEIDQVLIHGTRFIWEAAFFHKPSKTMILTDLLENIGDDYQHPASLLLRFWWKAVFRMWNNPKAAPEYQVGWGNRKAVKKCLQRILDWKAERVIIAHGELVENNVNEILSSAWQKVLNTQ